MDDLELKFRRIVKGVNIMTPEVVDYFKRGDYIVELSKGNGQFCGSYCYGVTVANVAENEHCTNLSKGFFNRDKNAALKEAMDYINSLS